MPPTKTILVSGATGKQGGAVIQALLAKQSADFEILALTRNKNSPSAQALAKLSPIIALVQGDLQDCDAIFKEAGKPVWGVFSVQLPGKQNAERDAGNRLVDAAVKQKVKHFVYSSVDRGGEAASDANDTDVPHFASKAQIERHLKESAGTEMTWTILRPVAFMDNISTSTFGKLFGAMWSAMPADTKLQLVSTKDIGVFAAEAFDKPHAYRNQSISLAGDALTFADANALYRNVKGLDMPRTYQVFGSLLKYAVPDVGRMFNFFETTGYGASLDACRAKHPAMQTLRKYLEEGSR